MCTAGSSLHQPVQAQSQEMVLQPKRWQAFACRDNLEDALQKLQEILDSAWKSVQPIEEDPVKKKKLEKQ